MDYLAKTAAWRLGPTALEKIFRLYGEMRFLELQIEHGEARHDLAQLDRIEERAHQLKMPKAYASMVYSLLGHIALVGQRLKKDHSSPL